MTVPSLSGQQKCFGLARGNCVVTWASEIGYHHRFDSASIGQHRFTWELGPRLSYPQRGLGIGGNIIIAFDEEGEAQLGIKTSAFRRFGFFSFNLGIGVFFHDSRKAGPFTYTAHAATGFREILEIITSIDVIDYRFGGSESRLYFGGRARKRDSSFSRTSAALSVALLVAAIIIS